MKIIILVLSLLFATLVGAETQLGEGAAFKNETPISKILENPSAFENKELTVSGIVTDVCSSRGCWMTIASDKKFQTFKVKVEDGKIIIPMNARGKKAAAKGQLQVIKLSKEQTIKHLEHLAEETNQKFDPSTVKEGQTIYQLKSNGIVIE